MATAYVFFVDMKKILIFLGVLLLPALVFAANHIPVGCVDIDENGAIDERDCGAPENDTCAASVCGGTGGETTGGETTEGARTNSGGNGTGIDRSRGTSDFQLPPGNPITEDTISEFLTSVANFLIAIGVLGAVITIVTGGIMYFGAGFSSNAVTKAKDIFKNALIGTLIILGVGVIINTISIIISGEFFGNF